MDATNDCEQVSRYLGQNGILSQTRKTNETLTHYEDDFPIRLNSRHIHMEKRSTTTSIEPPVPVDEDIIPLDDQQMLETDSLFASLESTNAKNLETNLISNNNSMLNYDDCIEDITNDGIDPPPSSSSPNFDHLSLTT